MHPRIALYAWAFAPIANLAGHYVPYPNQLRVLYGVAVAALLGWVTRGFRGARNDLLLGLSWPIGYGVAMIAVSYFGLDFAYSVRFHVLYQPLLHAIPFLTWFVVARYFATPVVLEALVLNAVVMAVHLFAVVALSDTIPRTVVDLSLPLGMAGGAVIGALFGSPAALSLSLAGLAFALWISLGRTLLGCGILALLVPAIGCASFHADRRRIAGSLAIAGALIVVIHVASSIRPSTVPASVGSGADPAPAATQPFAPESPAGPGARELAETQRVEEDAASRGRRDPLPNTAAPPHADGRMRSPGNTVERFFEGTDPTRAASDRLAGAMLAERFPHGIGYMVFMKESQRHIPYTTFTASGETLYGVSLHNTYLHLALEGGGPIVLIVALGTIFFARALHVLYAAGDHQTFLVLTAWALMAGLYGFFHQIYMTDYLFGLFAYALGAKARALAHNRRADTEPVIAR